MLGTTMPSWRLDEEDLALGQPLHLAGLEPTYEINIELFAALKLKISAFRLRFCRPVQMTAQPGKGSDAPSVCDFSTE